MENVKKHFEEEAKEFDDIIWKIIPYYDEMLEALISAISLPKSIPVKVIDLGCGTGTISNMVLKSFPLSIKIFTVLYVIEFWLFQKNRSH